MSQESPQRNSSAASRKKRECADFSNSLESYLNNIDRMGDSDPELQESLARSIDEVQHQLEQQLALFGFSALEYCRILELCVSGSAVPEDYFLYSSLRGDSGTGSAELLDGLKEWQKQIARLHHTMESCFKSGGDCSDARFRMQQLMGRYRLNGVMADELYQTASGYEELAPECCGQLEERFLMPAGEIKENLKILRGLRGKLDELYCRMAENNLRLVISIAVKYRDRDLQLNDIIQEGNMGLMTAVQRFDFKLGNKFSTYAGWWIKHYILKALAEQSRVVRLPLHMIQAIQNMNKAEQRFIQNEGREPESSELAALLEMPVARVSAMRKMASQAISLQAAVGKDEENPVSLDELIVPEENNEPWRNYAQKLLYDKLYEMLNALPERERQIVVYRFGLFGETPLPLTEISSKLNLSRERVRQLEKNVMNLLRTKEYLKFIDGISHLDG